MLVVPIVAASLMPGFVRSPWFGEQVREEKTPSGVRMLFNAPAEVHPDRPTLLVIYTTPNGNTIEQTMGCAMIPDLDWHYDIQHIAAQTRVLRQHEKRNVILVCMEAEGRSWPTWRTKHPDSDIRKLVEEVAGRMPGSSVSIALTGHSGGGSMIFGFINACETIPDQVERIALLDANYAYSDDEHHGDKLLRWLAKPDHHLVVMAYDDRRIELDGKRVVGPTGGTFRATHRMLGRFEKDMLLTHSTLGDFDHYTDDSSLITHHSSLGLYIHRNPQNKILHTVLVGEMNGFLRAFTGEKPGGPRAYSKYIQPAGVFLDTVPPRPKKAEGGTAIMKRVADLPRDKREEVLLSEFKAGNLPEFLRGFKTIRVKATDTKGREHTAIYQVMPDYLAVGSDKDFVRTPLTPMTAQPIADAFGCSLPTRKMVNDIYEQAEVKLEPKPLTEKREAVETFTQHNEIIEGQRAGKPLGLLVAGIKKDVVITNMLLAKPDHVAIYGWHKLDGTPIQPLTTVHINWYVDYSHGIRLVKRSMLVDGNPRDIRDVLADPDLCVLLSDEGPIAKACY
jgi:hypothetical protein